MVLTFPTLIPPLESNGSSTLSPTTFLGVTKEMIILYITNVTANKNSFTFLCLDNAKPSISLKFSNDTTL